MNTNGAGNGVECRLVIDGRVIEFTLPGPLVSMPAKAKAEKLHKKTRRAR